MAYNHYNRIIHSTIYRKFLLEACDIEYSIHETQRDVYAGIREYMGNSP